MEYLTKSRKFAWSKHCKMMFLTGSDASLAINYQTTEPSLITFFI